MLLLPFLACVPVLHSKGEDAVSALSCIGDGNSWPTGELLWTPPTDPQAFVTDAVTPDFCMDDQFADPVALYQFNTHYTVVDVSALWCVPCQNIAADVQATVDANPGLVYVTVMRENMENDPPTTEDLLYWAESFGIDQPVVSDPTGWSDPLTGGVIFPALLLLDDQLRVVTRVPESYLEPEALRNYLEGYLPG